MVIAFFEAANHGTIGVKTNNEDPATTYEQVTRTLNLTKNKKY